MQKDTRHQKAEIIDSTPLKTPNELITEYHDLARRLSETAEQIAEVKGDPMENPFTAIEWCIFRIESDLRTVQEALKSINQ